MKATLKPCPFCGGKPIFRHTHWADYNYDIVCEKCSSLFISYNADDSDIIGRWNNRDTGTGDSLTKDTATKQLIMSLIHTLDKCKTEAGHYNHDALMYLKPLVDAVRDMLGGGE